MVKNEIAKHYSVTGIWQILNGIFILPIIFYAIYVMLPQQNLTVTNNEIFRYNL